MDELWILYSDLIGYVKQVIMPLGVLAFSFLINAFVQYRIIKSKEYIVDNEAFKLKFLIAHGLACVLALVYAFLLYYLEGNQLPGLLGGIFFAFLISITTIQNKENGGYIESFDGASGAIMFITASINPYWFSVLHASIVFICFLKYRRKPEKKECESLWRYIIAYVEVMVVLALNRFIEPDTFLGVLWLNVIIISVFTLLLPLFEKKIVAVITDRIVG